MKKKSIIKKVAIGMVVAVLIIIVGFFVWTNKTYQPSDLLSQYVNQTAYTINDDLLVFKPQGEKKDRGIILYPGALVEPLAYGYYAKGLADAGYLVVIPNVAFNLALFDSEKASEVISLYTEVEDWAIGGHSMGGVAAAMYAKAHPEVIDDLILLGSYPAEMTDLSESEISVLSLYGENDGLTTHEDIEASKVLLPSHTVFKEIKGGNHAQFGMYGEQKGDLQATIDVITQQNQMVEETVNFLGNKENNVK